MMASPPRLRSNDRVLKYALAILRDLGLGQIVFRSNGPEKCSIATYATEMLRAGVSFPALMKLLGHTDPEMTMRYVDVALTDLQREFQLARSKPRHFTPQPKSRSTALRTGLAGVLDSIIATQHVLEMFRRSLPDTHVRKSLDRLSNRLTKILAE